jgi:hypothetical protein
MLAPPRERLNKLGSPSARSNASGSKRIDPRRTRSQLCDFARLAEPVAPPPPLLCRLGRNPPAKASHGLYDVYIATFGSPSNLYDRQR